MDRDESTSALTSYWTLLQLNPAGHYQAVVLPVAQHFLQTQLADLTRLNLEGDRLHQFLIDAAPPEAQLCLRCFVSSAIVGACESLVRQFGQHHRLQLNDLLPLVLDDDGTLHPTAYQPLSAHILQTFKPGSGNLFAWAMRCTRQHPDVKQFLLEHGVYLISPWALLNDTKPDHLATLLTQFHRWHPTAVQQACLLLASYRAVYLPDRLQQRQQQGDRAVCAPPTAAQLQRMSEKMQVATQVSLEPAVVLKQLQTLSQHIRQYRLARRGGFQSGQSFDEPETRAQLEYQLTESPDEASMEQFAFLQAYRQQFLSALQQAIAAVIQDRLQKTNPERGDRFLLALQAYYCDQRSMGEIAVMLGVRGQDTVSRLLNLKPLRADIRHHMVRQLQAIVWQQAIAYVTPAQLRAVDQQIQIALDEQLAALMQAEAQRDCNTTQI